jgi:uncharacterized protein (UPF0332 family)
MRDAGSESYRWCLDKAEQFLRAARSAFDTGLWETSVSRAYYALYHVVAAMLESRKGLSRDRWTHQQLLNDFRQHFARPGFLFSVRDARDLNQLLEERLSADYERTHFERRRAEDSLKRAEQLYHKILGVITNA